MMLRTTNKDKRTSATKLKPASPNAPATPKASTSHKFVAIARGHLPGVYPLSEFAFSMFEGHPSPLIQRFEEESVAQAWMEQVQSEDAQKAGQAENQTTDDIVEQLSKQFDKALGPPDTRLPKTVKTPQIPKTPKTPPKGKFKLYAIPRGIDGPQIQDSWKKAQASMLGSLNHGCKGFNLMAEALAYLEAEADDRGEVDADEEEETRVDARVSEHYKGELPFTQLLLRALKHPDIKRAIKKSKRKGSRRIRTNEVDSDDSDSSCSEPDGEGAAIPYLEGTKVKIAVGKMRKTFCERGRPGITIEDLACMRSHSSGGIHVLTMEGVIMIDKDPAPRKTDNVRLQFDCGNRSVLFNPDKERGGRTMADHTMPDILFRSSDDILRFLDQQRVAGIANHPTLVENIEGPFGEDHGTARWDIEISTLRMKMVEYREDLFGPGADRSSNDKKISFEAVLIYFFVCTWNRAAFAEPSSVGAIGRPSLLSKDVDDRWKRVKDKYLHVDLTPQRQEMVFKVAMFIREIRCDRCQAIASCQLFCLSCSHVGGKALYAAKGAFSTTAVQGPFELYYKKQGLIRETLRRARA